MHTCRHSTNISSSSLQEYKDDPLDYHSEQMPCLSAPPTWWHMPRSSTQAQQSSTNTITIPSANNILYFTDPSPHAADRLTHYPSLPLCLIHRLQLHL